MRPAEKALVHQVHPAKIGTDVTASVISNILFWRGHPKAALAARAVLPVAGSLAVLAMADLNALAATRRGQYVLAHMPPTAQAASRRCADGLGSPPAPRRAAGRWRGRHRRRLVARGMAANLHIAACPGGRCRHAPSPERQLRSITAGLDAVTGRQACVRPARRCAGFDA